MLIRNKSKVILIDSGDGDNDEVLNLPNLYFLLSLSIIAPISGSLIASHTLHKTIIADKTKNCFSFTKFVY